MKPLPNPSSAIILFLLFSLNIHAQQTNGYLKFNIKDLLQQEEKKGKNELTFLAVNTLNGTLLRVNEHDSVSHVLKYDLVFYIVGGKGKCKIGNAVFALNEGVIVFVPRNSEYSFYDVGRPLDIFELVSLGSMENTNKGNPDAESFASRQIESARVPDQNVWNSFLKRSSMIFGLYMLPKTLGGDSALTHKWDEVNLITHGSGKFQVGEIFLDVEPGDIIYVAKGHPHFFHSLRQDLDILIFFEMRSIE